jgi:hypothetical protein
MNITFNYDHTKSDLGEALGIPENYDELISDKIGQLVKILQVGKSVKDNGSSVSEIIEEMIATLPDDYIAILAGTYIKDILIENSIAEQR